MKKSTDVDEIPRKNLDWRILEQGDWGRMAKNERFLFFILTFVVKVLKKKKKKKKDKRRQKNR